jgi:hypothetical protein
MIYLDIADNFYTHAALHDWNNARADLNLSCYWKSLVRYETKTWDTAGLWILKPIIQWKNIEEMIFSASILFELKYWKQCVTKSAGKADGDNLHIQSNSWEKS